MANEKANENRQTRIGRKYLDLLHILPHANKLAEQHINFKSQVVKVPYYILIKCNLFIDIYHIYKRSYF